jgi:hypothetical protein
MKITKAQLKQIIKEELETVIDEGIFSRLGSGNLFGPEKTGGEIAHEKDQEKKSEMLADMIKWNPGKDPDTMEDIVNSAFYGWMEDRDNGQRVHSNEYYLKRAIDIKKRSADIDYGRRKRDEWEAEREAEGRRPPSAEEIAAERQKEEDKAYYDEKFDYYSRQRPEKDRLKPRHWGFRGGDYQTDPDYGMSPEEQAQRDLDKRRSR